VVTCEAWGGEGGPGGTGGAGGVGRAGGSGSGCANAAAGGTGGDGGNGGKGGNGGAGANGPDIFALYTSIVAGGSFQLTSTFGAGGPGGPVGTSDRVAVEVQPAATVRRRKREIQGIPSAGNAGNSRQGGAGAGRATG
jgi:hypothetical protein